MRNTVGLVAFAILMVTPGSVWADRDIQLEATKLSVRVPDDWQATATNGVDELRDSEGHLFGSLRLLAMTCADVLARTREVEPPWKLTADPIADAPSRWTGILRERPGFLSTSAPEQTATFCRELSSQGRANAVTVIGPYPDVTQMVRVIDEAITRMIGGSSAPATETPVEVSTTVYDGNTADTETAPPPPKETLFERFGPSLYELGLFLPRSADPPLECFPCFGGLAAISRTPWQGRSILAWS